MVSANGGVAPGRAAALLAGLQAGIAGTVAALIWLGASSAWQHRSFWTPANLMASTFYGDRAIHAGFASSTVSGLALYFSLYGVLGACFAAALAGRATGLRLLAIGLLFGLAWYLFSFGLVWKRVSPLVTLLHVQKTTMVGHLIYGGIVGRFEWFVEKGAR